MAETTIYLQREPVWHKWVKDRETGEPRLEGLRVTKTLKSRPDSVTGVLVKLKLRIPDAAFRPLSPAVEVEIPEAALAYEPTVTVEMPPDGTDG
jgi:hypothetical protein